MATIGGGMARGDMGVGMNGGMGGDLLQSVRPTYGRRGRMVIGHRRRYGGRLIALNRPPTKGEKELECRVVLCVYTCGIFELFRRCCCRNWGKAPPPDVDPDTGVPIEPKAPKAPVMPEDNFSSSKPGCCTGLKCGCIMTRYYGGRNIVITRPRTKGEKALDCRIISSLFTCGIFELFRRCCCRNCGKYPPPDVDPKTGVVIGPQTGVSIDPRTAIGMTQLAGRPVTVAPGMPENNGEVCRPSYAANPKSIIQVDGGEGNCGNSSSNYSSSKGNCGCSSSNYSSSKGNCGH